MNSIKELDPKFEFDPSWVDINIEDENIVSEDMDSTQDMYEIIYSEDEIGNVLDFVKNEYPESFEKINKDEFVEKLKTANREMIIDECPVYFTIQDNMEDKSSKLLIDDIDITEAYYKKPESQAIAVHNKLLNLFNANNWDSLELDLPKYYSKLQIIPVFEPDVEKSLETCKGFRAKIDNKYYKFLGGKTLLRIAKELIVIDDIIQKKDIDDNINLVGSKYKGLADTGDRIENINNCKVGDAVKLTRTALHDYGNDKLTEDSIEVRTLDNKSIGFIPEDYPAQTRIARFLPSNKSYDAKIVRINLEDKYTPVTIHVNINYKHLLDDFINGESEEEENINND